MHRARKLAVGNESVKPTAGSRPCRARIERGRERNEARCGSSRSIGWSCCAGCNA